MPGLLGTLALGQHALQVQQQGVEIAGHNIANVNNTAYARQRLQLQTSITIPTAVGPQGTGVQVVGIQQLRSSLLDNQVQVETGVGSFLKAQQDALQLGQAILGQVVDTDNSAATESVDGEYALAERLADLFSAFQDLSTSPTSIADRQAVLSQAQNLADEFNRIDQRLGALDEQLNSSVTADVASANELVTAIARLNREIVITERQPGSANDLRDLRQEKIEALAKLVDLTTVENSNGTIDLAIAGTTVVSGVEVTDTLESFDPGDGRLQVRTRSGATPLALSSGQIQGTITARDGALASLRTELDTLASELITQVNAIHHAGYSLTGSTGADLFTGTGAGTIGVNSALLGNPALVQASGVSDAQGDNQVALALAQLAEQRQPALNNQTFSQRYSQTVSSLGQALASVDAQLGDQTVVQDMLERQRDALSGVSLDEEMTDLTKYQKAFQASARIVTTIDEMIQTLLEM